MARRNDPSNSFTNKLYAYIFHTAVGLLTVTVEEAIEITPLLAIGQLYFTNVFINISLPICVYI